MTSDELRKAIPIAELRLVDHLTEKKDDGSPAQVVEVHWDGQLVMSIYVSRSPSVSIQTKHALMVGRDRGALNVATMVEPSERVQAAMQELLSQKLHESFAEIITKRAEADADQPVPKNKMN